MTRPRRASWAAGALAPLLLAGCGSLGSGFFGGGKTAFQCGSGGSFQVAITADSATARFPGDKSDVTLRRVTSASGEKYSDGRTTLWLKGGEAYVERNGSPLLFACRAAK
ncbi:MAG: MliC family protein [Pseudomonadota bacterium]|jgi:membrane-bound inhibitor of C-type lysozyme